jgi:acyl-CoA synthetase (AMP-forming)/AMP-acid ligase II
VAVRMLTSGTTGPPTRIDLPYEMLEQVMAGAKHYETGTGSDLRLRQGVVVVNAPLVHVSGIFRVVQAVLDGRRISLLERFTVDGWADAVRRHRPKTVSLVPTALRMVLDADLDDDVFESVRSVVSGTAPLDPDLAEAFTERYDVPVLTSYGATEFGGGVAGWNFTDHQQYGKEKRGSVGRAHAGCALRIVDPESGAVLAADEVGLLEVRAAQLGAADWVRTTDLARLDDDGFLWIVGRADQTILRGGFKVQPEVVRGALEQDPGVAEAAVVGVPDRRLGAVPVAVVERRAGHEIDGDGLLARAAEHLAPYEVPVSVTVVDALPRVASGKVDLAAVRDQVERVAAETGA